MLNGLRAHQSNQHAGIEQTPAIHVRHIRVFTFAQGFLRRAVTKQRPTSDHSIEPGNLPETLRSSCALATLNAS